MKNYEFTPDDSRAIFESYIKDKQRQLNEMQDGRYETVKTMYDMDDNEMEVTVRYEYYKGGKGARGDFGVPMEPDEPAQVNVISVTNIDTGDDVELSRSDLDQLEDEILGDVREADWQGGYDG